MDEFEATITLRVDSEAAPHLVLSAIERLLNRFPDLLGQYDIPVGRVQRHHIRVRRINREDEADSRL